MMWLGASERPLRPNARLQLPPSTLQLPSVVYYLCRLDPERATRRCAMAELVKDVVCGMEIDPDTAAGKSDYQGTTYYFCTQACKTTFDKDPAKYAGKKEAGHGASHH